MRAVWHEPMNATAEAVAFNCLGAAVPVARWTPLSTSLVAVVGVLFEPNTLTPPIGTPSSSKLTETWQAAGGGPVATVASSLAATRSFSSGAPAVQVPPIEREGA